MCGEERQTEVRLGRCGPRGVPGVLLLWQGVAPVRCWQLCVPGAAEGLSLPCSELSCSANLCCWTLIPTQSRNHHVLSHFLKVLLPRAAFLSSHTLVASPGMALSFPRAALPPPSPVSPSVPCSCPLGLCQSWEGKVFPVSIPNLCRAAGARQGRVTVSA